MLSLGYTRPMTDIRTWHWHIKAVFLWPKHFIFNNILINMLCFCNFSKIGVKLYLFSLTDAQCVLSYRGGGFILSKNKLSMWQFANFCTAQFCLDLMLMLWSHTYISKKALAKEGAGGVSNISSVPLAWLISPSANQKFEQILLYLYELQTQG